MTSKLTEKRIYQAIVDGTLDTIDVDAVVAWAEKKIAQLDHKAAKAKETAAAKRAEGDALKDAVLAAVTNEFQTIADITASIEGDDVTVSKVSYRLNTLAKEGVIEKGELVLEGEKGKRRVVAYKTLG